MANRHKRPSPERVGMQPWEGFEPQEIPPYNAPASALQGRPIFGQVPAQRGLVNRPDTRVRSTPTAASVAAPRRVNPYAHGALPSAFSPGGIKEKLEELRRRLLGGR